ncbi:MAG: hypothetical protein GXP44_00240 [bacterium]|nr:hypothetical protein [bacterium]
MQKIKKIIPVALVFGPMVAMAASFETILSKVGDLVQMIIPLLISIALLVFIWGIIQYVTAGDDEEKRKKSTNKILYGIIGLFAIVSVWGLVKVIQNTFGIENTTIDIPGDFTDQMTY